MAVVLRLDSIKIWQVGALCLSLMLNACASAPYQPGSLSAVTIRDRALTQSEGGVTVSAAVPGPEETELIFNLPLYQRGIQPIWLEVKNDSSDVLRYAPVGTDPEYFSGQEVAYFHRKGLSKEGMESLNDYFYDAAMPRRIPSGETRSGFVFTHARPGTKGFNVDLYSRDREDDVSFTFFVDVPGYEPDHSNAFFESLYTADQIQDLTRDQLRIALARKLNAEYSENEGYPVNGAVIATGEDVLKALIRAGWHEYPRTPAEMGAEISTFDGRIADVVFVRNERKGGERNELRFWKSPFLEAGVPVWMLQSVHYIGVAGGTMDPDIDDAILYLLQDIWYGQGLARFAWLKIEAIPTGVLLPVRATNDSEYFTSGTVLVSWLSGDLLSMLEVDLLTWDPSPTGSL